MNNDFITIEVAKKHEPWKNQMRFTPTPKVRSLLEAMNMEQEHMSETINSALQSYFNNMPASERQRLLSRSKHHY